MHRIKNRMFKSFTQSQSDIQGFARPFKIFQPIMENILQTNLVLVQKIDFYIQVSNLSPKERSERRHIFGCSSIRFDICIAYTSRDKSHTPVIQIFSFETSIILSQ